MKITATFIFLLTCLAPAAFAETLNPTLAVERRDNTLQVHFSLACGTLAKGFFFSPSRATLTVGLLVKKNAMACTKLPTTQTVVIDFLDLRRFKKFVPLTALDKNKRLQRFEVEELEIKKLRPAPVHYQVRMLTRTLCAKGHGFVLRPNAGDLEIAAAEVVQGNEEALCHSKKIRKVLFNKNLARYQLRTLGQNQGDTQTLFRLKLTAVDPASLRYQQGSWSLRYQRRCNEAPVGLVLRRRDAQAVDLGFLVAEYFNLHCEDAKAMWSTFELKNFKVSRNLQVSFLNQAIPNLGLTPPFETSVDEHRSDRVYLEYYRRCQQGWAGVYRLDSKGRLAVGVLTVPSSSCGKFYKSSLMQPLPKDLALFPLQLLHDPLKL